MITPQFEVSQDDQFIFVSIRAPYIKASLIQFEVQDNVFVFSLPPYYLRLRFPGKIVEDEFMESHYELETSTVKCKVAKQTKGEHFADLDMLNKLLATKKEQEKAGIQEVADESGDDDEEELDWDIEIEQQPPSLLDSIKYGFNNQYNEIVGVSAQAGNEINELVDPEHSPPEAREQTDQLGVDQFNVDYYFCDLFENTMIDEVLAWEFSENYDLDGAEKDRLMQLPARKVIAVNPKETYVGLISLVFGLLYDLRANMGDSTIESSWAVGKLCPQMACLYTYQQVLPLMISCTRRSLVFPLYRNWKLSVRVWKDVLAVLKQGRKAVLWCLVKLLAVFENDLHFCYRKIWLEDYTLWTQYSSEKVLAGLASEVEKALAQLAKASVGLDLDEYEAAAREAIEEQRNKSDSDDEE